MKPTLTEILDDLINGRIPDNRVSLSRGLHLQYRLATLETPMNRLLCYRYGEKSPSKRELDTVRKKLEIIQAIRVTQGKPFAYVTGGRERQCVVFSWPPVTPPRQARLPLDLPPDTWHVD